LQGNDVLEVAFRCNFIRELGPSDPTSSSEQSLQSKDFRIWSTVPDGSKAIVAASEDGSLYVDLRANPPYLHESNQEYDLALTDLTVVRFIRITAMGAPVTIDAIQAY
jgi:hypothetical protein